MKKRGLKTIFVALALLGTQLPGANRYVDSAVSSSGNGTSWASAWKNISNITGLSSGDIVYFSGGTTAKTYSVPANYIFDVANVTWKIGQDAGHNGTAIFSGSGEFIVLRAAGVTISGDAGDGQRHFKTSGFYQVFNATHANADNWHIEYLDGGTGLTRFGYFDANTGGELNHCFGQGGANCDGLFYWQPTGSTYTSNKVHHNWFRIPNKGDGIGADGFQASQSYTSFYDNLIEGFILSSYNTGQHQDGHQSIGNTRFTKFYNNTYRDIGNYPIYLEGYLDGHSDVWIYNNVFTITIASIQNASPQMIAIGPNNSATGSIVFSNIKVWNNTLDGTADDTGIAIRNPGSKIATFTNCECKNNVLVNCAAPILNGSVAASNNVNYSTAQGSVHFVSYANLSANNDFHIKAGESGLTGAGTNLSSYFTTDKDGNTRSTWDIGAYAASGSPPPAQPPSNLQGTPTSSSVALTWTDNASDETGYELDWSTSQFGPFTTIPLAANTTSRTVSSLNPATDYWFRARATGGANENYSATVKVTTLSVASTINISPSGAIDFGLRVVGATPTTVTRTVTAVGGTVTGSVTEGSAHYSVTNGSYNLSAGQSQVVTFTYDPQAAGTHAVTFTWTGGGGATTTGSGSAYGIVATQAAAEDVSWSAWDADGLFSATGWDIQAASQYITATEQTTNYSTAPSALYGVHLETPGVYLARVTYSAASDGANSCFFTFNGAPSPATYAIWDTLVTGSGTYTTDSVAWRGSLNVSTYAEAEFFPKEFAINQAGDYQVEIRGREPGLRLRTITLELQAPQEDPPNAPTNVLATPDSDTQVTLTWTPPANATEQYVQRSTTSGSGFSTIATVGATATSYVDSGRTASTTYFYRVIAHNDGGDSTPSSEANATTEAAPEETLPSPTGGRLEPVNPINSTNLFL